MSNSREPIIISGVHLDLTPALKEIVEDKFEKLFRHEGQIIRVRVDLEHHANNSKFREFIAKGHIEIHGPSLIATVETEDLYKSIDLLVLKLDRMLRRRSRLRKVKRNHPHDVEIPAEIPKAS